MLPEHNCQMTLPPSKVLLSTSNWMVLITRSVSLKSNSHFMEALEVPASECAKIRFL